MRNTRPRPGCGRARTVAHPSSATDLRCGSIRGAKTRRRSGTCAACSETLATTAADLPVVSKDLALVEALERLNNDRQLYAQLARSLRADQGQAVTTAQAFLEQGLTKEALTTLHTLKGVTATLGARTVAQLAAELEGQIRAAAPTATLFAALDTALHHADGEHGPVRPSQAQSRIRMTLWTHKAIRGPEMFPTSVGASPGRGPSGNLGLLLRLIP